MAEYSTKCIQVTPPYDYAQEGNTQTLSKADATADFFKTNNAVLIKRKKDLDNFPFTIRVFDRQERIFDLEVATDLNYMIRSSQEGKKECYKIYAFGQLTQYNHLVDAVKLTGEGFNGDSAPTVDQVFNNGISGGLVYGIPKGSVLAKLFWEFDIKIDDQFRIPTCRFNTEWDLVQVAREKGVKLVGEQFTREFLNLEEAIQQRRIYDYLTGLIENAIPGYQLSTAHAGSFTTGSRVSRARELVPGLQNFAAYFEDEPRKTFAQLAKKEPKRYLTLVGAIAEVIHGIGVEPPAPKALRRIG